MLCLPNLIYNNQHKLRRRQIQIDDFLQSWNQFFSAFPLSLSGTKVWKAIPEKTLNKWMFRKSLKPRYCFDQDMSGRPLMPLDTPWKEKSGMEEMRTCNAKQCAIFAACSPRGAEHAACRIRARAISSQHGFMSAFSLLPKQSGRLAGLNWGEMGTLCVLSDAPEIQAIIWQALRVRRN